MHRRHVDVDSTAGGRGNGGSVATDLAVAGLAVEMEHSVILNLALGNYPVPDAFATTTGARPLSDKIG